MVPLTGSDGAPAAGPHHRLVQLDLVPEGEPPNRLQLILRIVDLRRQPHRDPDRALAVGQAEIVHGTDDDALLEQPLRQIASNAGVDGSVVAGKVRESDDPTEYEKFYAILKKNLRLRHEVNPTHTLPELMKVKELFPEKSS